MTKQIKTAADPEIIAIGIVHNALKDLDAEARGRVLTYVSSKFNIANPVTYADSEVGSSSPPITSSSESESTGGDGLEEISPAGKKWITRNGIIPSKLMSIFSLGIDEIDLVSKSVPGNKKSQRMRNVFLLKGIAAYLGTGSARITHEQIKEACLHYDAWDGPNFSANFKTMSADISGGKDSGYTLTAKGIAEATTLVKSMLGLGS